MPQTIGQQLKQARSERGLTIDQASRALHIRPNYIEALEEDHRKELPSPVQGKGFLRMYAEYLALPVQPLLDAWDGKLPPLPAEPSEPPVSPPEETADSEALPLLPREELILPEISPEPQPQPEPSLPEPQLPAPPPPVDLPSQTAFETIGRQLKRQREALGLSLAEVERYTHVRAHYLKALEEGHIDDLPSPVQGRGMLSNYAHFLNLNVEGLLLQFAEGLQTSRLERRTQDQPVKATQRPTARPAPAKTSARRLLSRDLFVSTLLVVIVLVFALWTAAQVDALKTRTEAASPPSIADVLLNKPTSTSPATATPTPQAILSTLAPGEVKSGASGPTAQPATTLTVPVSGSAPLQVYVLARMRAFLRITIDGKVAFDGRIAPGTPYTFAGEKKIELLTGNAAALQIYFNQKDLGTSGQMGQVKALIFTKEGMLTPTPQFTSTATRTVQPTSTMQPSPTQPTNTITPFVP